MTTRDEEKGDSGATVARSGTADRPVAILSGNDREHLLLTLAAEHVGIPCAPISPAYSLLSSDFELGVNRIELRCSQVITCQPGQLGAGIDDCSLGDPVGEAF